MTFDEAKKFLGDAIKKDGDLYDLGWYLDYSKGSGSATLDGEFSAESLEAISTYMKENEKW